MAHIDEAVLQMDWGDETHLMIAVARISQPGTFCPADFGAAQQDGAREREVAQRVGEITSEEAQKYGVSGEYHIHIPLATTMYIRQDHQPTGFWPQGATVDPRTPQGPNQYVYRRT